MSVSKKDELRVRLGNKRVARIKEQALIPVKPLSDKDKERKARLLNLSAFGQEKPVPVYHDKAELPSHSLHVRTMSDKLGRHSNAIAARVYAIEHTNKETGQVTRQIVRHVEREEIMSVQEREAFLNDVLNGKRRDPLQAAKPRALSPFKRDGKRMTPIVTHKK